MTRGGSASRKRSIRGRSQTGKILRQQCRYYLTGTCTRSPCEYWRPPECQFCKKERDAKQEISAYSRTMRLKNNHVKSPKRAKTLITEKAPTRVLWLLWKLYHNWVASSKTRKHWFLKEEDGPGETRCKKSWDQFEKCGSLTLRHVKQVSGKRKDFRLETQVKIPHQRSPHAVKFEDRSQEETERQERCARSKAWNFAKNIYKFKEKDKASFHSPAEEWVLPAASTKEPEEREFVVDSGASMHMVSRKDLNCRIGDYDDIEESDDGDDGQRRGADKRRSHSIRQRIGLIRDSDAAWRNTRSSFTRKLCEDHGYTYHWTSGQKPHLTKNGKKINC